MHIIAGRERVFRVRHDDDVLLRFEDFDKLRVEDLLIERVDDVELILDEHFGDGGDIARVQADPVSYTHLDVYKRQGSMRTASPER